MKKEYTRQIIVNRKEAIVLCSRFVLAGKIFSATFVQMPQIKWNKKKESDLPKNWGYSRTYKSARYEVKTHLVHKENPIAATTDHIENKKVQLKDSDTYLRKYAIVFLMDEFSTHWKTFLKENPSTSDLTPEEYQIVKEKEGNKFYRNLNFETVRAFKTEGINFWVSDSDIPNQLLTEEETAHLEMA